MTKAVNHAHNGIVCIIGTLVTIGFIVSGMVHGNVAHLCFSLISAPFLLISYTLYKDQKGLDD